MKNTMKTELQFSLKIFTFTFEGHGDQQNCFQKVCSYFNMINSAVFVNDFAAFDKKKMNH